MADPKYTAITRRGIEAIVDASTAGTLLEIKYAVPIYDYRADTSVNPIDFSDENVNINTLYSNLDIDYTGLGGDILWNGDNNYSLSPTHLDTSTFDYVDFATGSTLSGNTISHIPFGSPQKINLINGLPVHSNGWKIFNTDYVWDRAIASLTNVTSAVLTTAVNPNAPATEADIVNHAYDTVSYTSLSNELTQGAVASRACFTVQFGSDILSDFKFNVIATFAVKRDANYAVSSEPPFLFSITVLPNTVIKSNSLDNAIQNYSLDLNFDFTFDVTSSFNKILYIDNSDANAISWHTKGDGTIGTSRNIAVFDRYNNADHFNISKLLIGVTKYKDAAGNIITAIPSMGEVYQDQTDPFPSNWKTYNVLTTPSINGYELTFSGDFANILTSIATGSGFGFSARYGFHTKSPLITDPDLPAYKRYFAPSLGNASNDILSNALYEALWDTERWDSVHTLNGMTAMNGRRVNTLWDYSLYASKSVFVTSANDYSTDYLLSADVISGYRATNLSFIVDNTFEFLLSDSPAYYSVMKTVRDPLTNNASTKAVDVWAPFYGTLTGDVYKHWTRTKDNLRANNDLFLRTDITTKTTGYDTATTDQGNIYILAGISDTSPINRRSSGQIFTADSMSATRSVMIKALSVILNGDLIPYNIGSTIGTASQHFDTVYTNSINGNAGLSDVGWVFGNIGDRKPTIQASGSLGGIIGAQLKPIEKIYVTNAVASLINGIGSGSNILSISESTTSFIDVSNIVTSAGGDVTSAAQIISNFSYTASQDKSIVVKFTLNAKLDRGASTDIPYVEFNIKDSTFINKIFGYAATSQLKMAVAIPYSQVTSGYINSNVEFTFATNAALSTRSVSTCPVSLTDTAAGTIDFSAENWWIGTTDNNAIETTNIFGVLTDDIFFTFANFNSWYVTNRASAIAADNSYYLPYYLNDGFTYPTSFNATQANEFKLWLDVNADDALDGSAYKTRINNQFATDMTTDIKYNTVSGTIGKADYFITTKTGSQTKYVSHRALITSPIYSSAVQTSAMFDNNNIASTEDIYIIGSLTSAFSTWWMDSRGNYSILRAIWHCEVGLAQNNVSVVYPENADKLDNTIKLTLGSLRNVSDPTNASEFLGGDPDTSVFAFTPAITNLQYWYAANDSLNFNNKYNISHTNNIFLLDKNLLTANSSTWGLNATSANITYLNNYISDIQNIYKYCYTGGTTFKSVWDYVESIIVVERTFYITVTGSSIIDIFDNASNDVYVNSNNSYILAETGKKMDSTYTLSYRGLVFSDYDGVSGLVYKVINIVVPCISDIVLKNTSGTAKLNIIPLPFSDVVQGTNIGDDAVVLDGTVYEECFTEGINGISRALLIT